MSRFNNEIDNKETIALLLHDQKDELKHLVPHIGERFLTLLTIQILKDIFLADKEKVCTIYNTFSFSIEVHLC